MEIYSDLIKQIKGKQYPAGNFLPPERALSDLYNVERPTLRRALTLLADDGYISKIQGAGNKVIYNENQVKEATEQPKTIVYVLPDSQGERGSQPYHMEICTLLEKLCSKKNYSLIFTKARPLGDNVPQWLYSDSVVGAIWVSDVSPTLLDNAHKLNIPSVLCSAKYDNFPKINVDDIGGSYAATNHLIERGCKRIVHITGMKEYHNTKGRLEGYKRALLVNGLPIREGDILNGDWGYNSAYNLMTDFLVENPDVDGIFAANDMMALGAMNAASKLGFLIPSQIKIVGIDNIEQASIATIPLTTISFSQQDIASCLFILLNEVFANTPVPNEIIMPGHLIVRSST